MLRPADPNYQLNLEDIKASLNDKNRQFWPVYFQEIVPAMYAEIERLQAATPAPASDEVLAQIEAELAEYMASELLMTGRVPSGARESYVFPYTRDVTVLLARVRQAEAKVGKVYQVLDAECKRLLDDAESNCTPEQKAFYQNQLGAIALFEMHLEKEVARPTVKGGQPHA